MINTKRGAQDISIYMQTWRPSKATSGHQLCLLPRRGRQPRYGRQFRLLPYRGRQLRLLPYRGHQLRILPRWDHQLRLLPYWGH